MDPQLREAARRWEVYPEDVESQERLMGELGRARTAGLPPTTRALAAERLWQHNSAFAADLLVKAQEWGTLGRIADVGPGAWGPEEAFRATILAWAMKCRLLIAAKFPRYAHDTHRGEIAMFISHVGHFPLRTNVRYIQVGYRRAHPETLSPPGAERLVELKPDGLIGDHAPYAFVVARSCALGAPGDILPAASAYAPRKPVRGNIFDEQNGMGLMSWAGPVNNPARIAEKTPADLPDSELTRRIRQGGTKSPRPLPIPTAS